MAQQRVSRKYLPEFVYGGMDGAITTFAVVSGVMGAELSPAIVLILGFANLFADGFSMAMSNYASTRSANELRTAADRPHHRNKKPIPTALATFVSFVTIGLIPVLPFLFGNGWASFRASIIMTGIAFIIIGAMKGSITKKSKLRSATGTFFIGGTAATIAYLVGNFLRGIV